MDTLLKALFIVSATLLISVVAAHYTLALWR